MDLFSILIILALAMVVCVASFILCAIRLTRWRLIDYFRLNRFFGVPKIKSLTKEELNVAVAYFAWVVMDERYMIRNGCSVVEISPMSALQGHKYFVISLDNRPFEDVCRVTVDTDITGKEVKATVVAQTVKDFENMMNIMGWDLREVMRNLRAVEANVKEVRQNIINRYVDYMLREIL